MIKIVSFSYKKPPSFLDDPDVLVMDCRNIDNPHHVPELKPLTGQDPAVQQFVMDCPTANFLLTRAIKSMQRGLFGTMAFGCVGGRHRSVAMAERLHASLAMQGIETRLEHLAL